MHQAIDKLVAAQSAPFASKAQIDDINNALEHLHQAFTNDSQKARAISFAEAARADAQAKDAAKFKSDLSEAIAAANAVIGTDAAPAPAVASSPAVPASPAVPSAPAVAAPVTLSQDQAHALVLIKGDNAEGTGFLAKVNNAPVVFTNQHVLANNPNLKITTCTGTTVEMVSIKGATDRDLAMIAVKDAGFSYLALAPDLTAVTNGDDAITPGNSEGGEVMLNTGGKVLGIGPDRVEISNPIYHGNSGGPVVDGKTHQVIAVVAMAMKVDNADALDKASFASRDSAIRGGMRYFGLRVDNVPSWEDLDWKNFQDETAFLDKFDLRSRCLDSFLNSPTTTQAQPGKKKKKKQKQEAAPTPAPADNSDLARLWLQDSALVKANDQFDDQTSGSADTAQQLDALRELLGNIVYAANADVTTVQNANNFYSYDRVRAKEELAYRQALLDELNGISNNIDRLGHLPRTNN
jgi:S1-C subfamily serine protease